MLNEGTIDQMLRVIYKTPETLTNEKELRQIIKQSIILGNHKDKFKYLNELRDATEFLNNIMQESINKILLENYTEKYNSKEIWFTPLELSKLFHLQKVSIHKWIESGKIVRYEQKIKGGNIRIPSSEIDRIIETLPKYKNLWLNRNN
jgi:hypothetical protein